jgi:hypothetical protein
VEAVHPGKHRVRVLLGTVAVLLVAVVGWFVLAGDGGGASEAPVSEAEAREFFDRIVAAAQSRDWAALCGLSGAKFNCEYDLDQIGRDRLPPERPTIVETRFHEKQVKGGSTGRVLVVEGTDGRGRPYHTEVMVQRYEGRLEGVNVVYWSNSEIFERDRNERRLRESKP